MSRFDAAGGPRRSREKCMKKYYICAALTAAGLASPWPPGPT